MLSCAPLGGLLLTERFTAGRPAGRDLGRSSRLVSPALRELLGQLDGERCRFPSCTRTRNLHAHYVVFWGAGGPTDLANLVNGESTPEPQRHQKGWGDGRSVTLRSSRCDTWRMPTTRPRLAITETASIAHALDLAAERWPGKTRAQLVALLVEQGVQHIHDEEGQRQSAIEATSGALTGAYGDAYLADLREDWPA